MSGEHIVSRSMWQTKYVTVEGLPSSKQPLTISIERLTTKCLCAQHNSALSPLDATAADVINALRWFEEEGLRRQGNGDRTPATLVVDGAAFRRWTMKTIFNIAATHQSALDGWMPGPDAAAFVYGMKDLPVGAGLYSASQPGDRLAVQDRVYVHLGKTDKDPHPRAASLVLRGGYEFVMTWDCTPADLGWGLKLGDRILSPSALYPLHRLNFVDRRELPVNLVLEFDYSGTADFESQPLVAALRKRFRAPPRHRKR